MNLYMVMKHCWQSIWRLATNARPTTSLHALILTYSLYFPMTNIAIDQVTCMIDSLGHTSKSVHEAPLHDELSPLVMTIPICIY